MGAMLIGYGAIDTRCVVSGLITSSAGLCLDDAGVGGELFMPAQAASSIQDEAASNKFSLDRKCCVWECIVA